MFFNKLIDNIFGFEVFIFSAKYDERDKIKNVLPMSPGVKIRPLILSHEVKALIIGITASESFHRID